MREQKVRIYMRVTRNVVMESKISQHTFLGNSSIQKSMAYEPSSSIDRFIGANCFGK